ncbi:hypothetical protein PAXINDRAFT_13273 [Paxillus involutus ATCC 200175]|uniref:Uncharacterized protein n=1 Tax=Paxillus involutus ATCC 200175 TaxID=664439 RepID=A0A0C9SWI5_PAXIN|nr:hypothetical protein PAXINDRAFT_13273 [Paxillus involutus ATCC 200175]
MRFDPANPKLTISELDPNDYEGTINWVEMSQNPDLNGDYYNMFNVDGVKGYNGTFVPFGGNLTAALDSFIISITVPNADTYFDNSNFMGPVPLPIKLDPDLGITQYNCTSNSTTTTSASSPFPSQPPYVALVVLINGGIVQWAL